MRPSFSHVLDLGVEEVRQQIVARIETAGARCEVKSFTGFVCLRVPEDERRLWSPRLNVSLEPGEDGGTVLHGTYGPTANLWSLLLYAGLIAGSLALFSGILGYCQWKIGMYPWGLWIFGPMLAFLAGLYLAAQFGQKLGARQTFLLHQIYETAVGRTVEIR